MLEVSIEALQDAIRGFQHGESIWVESVPVTETFEGEVVWSGEVHVFDLVDPLSVGRVYAWSHSVDDSANRKFYVIAHDPDVDSPEKAVRAAIIEGSGND